MGLELGAVYANGTFKPLAYLKVAGVFLFSLACLAFGLTYGGAADGSVESVSAAKPEAVLEAVIKPDASAEVKSVVGSLDVAKAESGDAEPVKPVAHEIEAVDEVAGVEGVDAQESETVTFEDMQYVLPKDRTAQLNKDALKSFDGELVAFAGEQVHMTKGLIDALEFVDAQSHLPKLKRDALRALAYSGALTIQNAHDTVVLQRYSDTGAAVASCAYFGLDNEIKFLVERMFTYLIEGKRDYKQALIVGSLSQVDLAPLSRDKRFIEDAIMRCSESISVWLR